MQPSFSFSTKARPWLIGAFAFILLVRIAMLFQIPFTDNSESRYAEMARWMTVSHDWITPQITPGNPFWAKPPLSMWLSAAGIDIFGANEFGARIFIFLTALATVALVYQWLKSNRGRDFALAGSFMLFTSVLFVVTSGTVMTDLAMLAATTLCMISFWNAVNVQKNARIWSYAFFVGIGLGLLAKGPVSTVLTMLPIGAWALWTRSIPATLKRLPWISGSLVAAAIAAPWYIAAEIKTPGFLNYFIFGEHIGRFLIKGWQGDLYGHAHPAPRGTIWVYALVGLMPWSLSLFISLPAFLRKDSSARESWRSDHLRWVPYLICWTFVPLLFFTLSRNIISTYPLVALPAASALIVETWRIAFRARTVDALLKLGSGVATILIVGVWGLFQIFPDHAPKDSEKRMIAYINGLPEFEAADVYYRRRSIYSAVFYRESGIHFITEQEVPLLIRNDSRDLLVVRSKDLKNLEPSIGHRFDPLVTIGDETLLAEKPEPLTASASNN